MKKIKLSIPLEGCELNSTEMKNVTGGGGCTYYDGATGDPTSGLSRQDAQQMKDVNGGDYRC